MSTILKALRQLEGEKQQAERSLIEEVVEPTANLRRGTSRMRRRARLPGWLGGALVTAGVGLLGWVLIPLVVGHAPGASEPGPARMAGPPTGTATETGIGTGNALGRRSVVETGSAVDSPATIADRTPAAIDDPAQELAVQTTDARGREGLSGSAPTAPPAQVASAASKKRGPEFIAPPPAVAAAPSTRTASAVAARPAMASSDAPLVKAAEIVKTARPAPVVAAAVARDEVGKRASAERALVATPTPTPTPRAGRSRSIDVDEQPIGLIELARVEEAEVRSEGSATRPAEVDVAAPAPVRRDAPVATAVPEPDVRVVERPAELLAPDVVVAGTVWHPSSARREADLRTESGLIRRVREGEKVLDYRIVEITPSAVVFGRGDRTVRKRIGEN